MKITVVGAGLEVVGFAAEALGKTLRTVADNVLPLLHRQLEINIAAFQGLSSSGAVFQGGLQSMINNAANAGLTLQQLDVVVKTNKESLMFFKFKPFPIYPKQYCNRQQGP